MKYFISDLDGTLLQDKHGIHPKDIDAINFLAKLPMRFGIATGRDLGFCKELLKKANLKADFMILNNGGSVFVDNKKVMEMEIPAQEIQTIMAFIKPFIGILHPFVCDENRIFYMMKHAYSISSWEAIKKELSYLGNICDKDILEQIEQIASPIIKLSIYVKDESQTMHWLTKLQDRFSKDYEVLMTASDYIEFTKKGVHKGTALLELEDYLHVHASDVVFIGDGENDIALMDLAGYSFVMNSASESVKQHADCIVSSVREAIAILHSHYDNDNDYSDNKKCHIQLPSDID